MNKYCESRLDRKTDYQLVCLRFESQAPHPTPKTTRYSSDYSLTNKHVNEIILAYQCYVCSRTSCCLHRRTIGNGLLLSSHQIKSALVGQGYVCKTSVQYLPQYKGHYLHNKDNVSSSSSNVLCMYKGREKKRKRRISRCLIFHFSFLILFWLWVVTHFKYLMHFQIVSVRYSTVS